MSRQAFEVPDELNGRRLDQALAALVPALSRRGARGLIQSGAVYLGGRRCRTASKFVLTGSVIAVEHLEPRKPAPVPPVRILWQGQAILAVDKPGSVPFAPTRTTVEGTLLYALARRFGLPLNQVRPVHRLDTPTSGVALVALTAEAAAFLGQSLQGGRVRKTYLAWVMGSPVPPEGEWAMALSEARDGAVRVDAGGRPSRTLYRVAERRGDHTLLELSPLSGRTHQIRVHCAAAGHPILGDKKYGGRAAALAPRALLHAWRIRFPLPGGGEQTVEAPVPHDMA